MWQLFLLRAMPLCVTLALNVLLPVVLRKRVHEQAVSSLLLEKEEAKPEGHDTLEYLLTWRDLITTIITGLFVLLFSIADKTIEEITVSHPVVVNQPLNWTVVILVAMIFTVPLLLAVIWFLTEKLGLRPMQSKLKYWCLFICLVLPLYIISFLISYYL